MQVAQQICFILISGIAIFLFWKKAVGIRKAIMLGQLFVSDSSPGDKWRNVLLLALGQKKMFRKPLVAILHFIVYAGFIIINIEVLEIVLDGIFGTHRLFSKPLGSVYPWIINSFEILAVLVILACAVFLIRRNIIKVGRLASPDLRGWPRRDANIILLTEIVLMSAFLKMNAADGLLQLRGVEHYAASPTGSFVISQYIQPFMESFTNSSLIAIERICWWFHIIGIFVFLNYLPYSKHLHIILAFPNAYYARVTPYGKMDNMPAVQQEVLYAMQPELAPTTNTDATPSRFGAKDITDLTRKNLLDAYSCTECGRCTTACPANMTGKKLSPRKIMMDTRDRMEELIRNNFNTDNGRTLLHNYITVEELRACTTCNACVQECPVSISPVEIILSMRRYLVMEESSSPQEWTAMFGNIENNFAPWKFSPDERASWNHKM